MINWYKGKFIHKKHHKDHFSVETYAGMSVIGYKCHGCGYEWYETRRAHLHTKTQIKKQGVGMKQIKYIAALVVIWTISFNTWGL